MKTGLEAISFYSSNYYIDLNLIAEARNEAPERFTTSIGQKLMAVPPPGEDVVTLAVNAAAQVLEGIDKAAIDLLIFATESGIDQSKAAGIFVHQLLGLPPRCRVFEIKQACYGATAGLQMALSHLQQHPTSKVLIVGSDIARYGLNTPGEATQGGGAVAMLLSSEPKILHFEGISGFYTEDVMDFWRPNYRDEALVDGKASVRIYIKSLIESFKHYQEQSGRELKDFDSFCYHLPFTRMGETAHRKLLRALNETAEPQTIEAMLAPSLIYNQLTGNCYAASLYLALISLLENSDEDLAGKRIGLFSYGSGCMGEFFSAVVEEGYRDHLKKACHQKNLENREALSYERYKEFYTFETPVDGSELTLPEYETGICRLSALKDHKRIYEPVSADS